ncbi:MAG: hypothetical protein GDA43_22165 [Hormoscilla sp. SP5CHS1]|nr:hypothetical protein [Hormoscilla sp. SP12CHS1]MBC6455558.1 hypothetical protein [Hormoscilla sp. SP5CHS1]
MGDYRRGGNYFLDEAWEAAAIAQLAADISEMPMGMHTVISEGGELVRGAAAAGC